MHEERSHLNTSHHHNSCMVALRYTCMFQYSVNTCKKLRISVYGFILYITLKKVYSSWVDCEKHNIKSVFFSFVSH